MTDLLASAMTESELQSAVEEMARWLGWYVFHDQDARRNPAGLPDIVAVHPVQRRLLWAELKTSKGRLRPAQADWRDALVAAGATVYLWRPEDWRNGSIERILRGER
jgi:hypothetical protein